jgi:hypothetical protein
MGVQMGVQMVSRRVHISQSCSRRGAGLAMGWCTGGPAQVEVLTQQCEASLQEPLAHVVPYVKQLVKHTGLDSPQPPSAPSTLSPTCVAAMSTSPFLGVHRLLTEPISVMASARASSVWGRCRFISSPSKSALKGEHTHSLKRSVRPGRT